MSTTTSTPTKKRGRLLVTIGILLTLAFGIPKFKMMFVEHDSKQKSKATMAELQKARYSLPSVAAIRPQAPLARGWQDILAPAGDTTSAYVPTEQGYDLVFCEVGPGNICKGDTEITYRRFCEIGGGKKIPWDPQICKYNFGVAVQSSTGTPIRMKYEYRLRQPDEEVPVKYASLG
ncbi:MAG: hypothetical protein AB199_02270 [Parcubacteria bacterium C7867-004]|nr:MAG: hypothetical protein AB199_02270 [Parcubacteria bacterium C7867-004]